MYENTLGFYGGFTMRNNILCTFIGGVGSMIIAFFGGWDNGLQALLLFMLIDYISGVAVAAIFKNSDKSESGALSSKAGFKGLCRKGMMLLFVLIGFQLDVMLKLDYVRNAVIIGFCANELISIVENAGLMGLPLPKAVTHAIAILKDKAEEEKTA